MREVEAELIDLSDADLTDMAVESFHQSFSHGGTGLNWDERQLLHEIEYYMGRRQLLEFLQEGEYGMNGGADGKN